MYFYKLFDYIISSDVEFFQLTPSLNKKVDIKIFIEKKALPKRLEGKVDSYFFYNKNLKLEHNGNEALLHYKNSGTFYINTKYQVIIAKKKASIEVLKQLLVGGVLGIYMLLQQKFALHGCAINTNQGAVIFMGPSGVGKSTLSASCYKEGYKILSDDVCLIQRKNNTFFVIPSYPNLKLKEDTAQELGFTKERLAKERFVWDKYQLNIQQNFEESPQVLKAIYLLSPQEHLTHLSIAGLPNDLIKTKALMTNVYRHFMITALKLHKEHFNFCTLLAQQVPVFQINRPKIGFHQKNIINKILKG